MIGDPDAVTRQLEFLHRTLGFEEFFIWLNQGLSPHDQVLDTLELFATKVMPRLG